MSTPASVPPGWYPDPTTPGAVRWWDGARWTDHTGAASASGAVTSTAPDGTKPDTVWIWLIVLLPLVTFIPMFTVDWNGFIEASLAASDSPRASMQAQFALFTDPGYLATLVLGWLILVASIVFAWLDARELRRRGVVNPFPWPWAFTALAGAGMLVYVIGRTVVVKRRTGRGLGPIWGLVATFVVGLIVAIALVVQILGAVAETVPFS